LLAILKDTSIYAIGDILTKGISFFAIVFYAHFLSQSDMGAYGYILVIIGFINTFLLLGLDNAYARYFFEYKHIYEKQILTSTLFFFLIVWIVVILFLPLIFSDKISFFLFEMDSYNLVFFLALLSLPLKLISSMSNQVLRNQFKTKKFIQFNLIGIMITVFGAILLLNLTSLNMASIFLSMIISDIIVLPFRIVSMKELFIKKINFNILKKILLFGVPFLPASIAYWIFSSADRVMLESMSSLESVGVYTVAVSLGAIMSIISNSIGQAWSPHVMKSYEDNIEKARVLCSNFFNFLISIVLFIIFCTFMIGAELIDLLFPDTYDNLFYPMLFLLLGIGFKTTTQVTAIGISLAKKTIYIVYITIIIALVNIGLNYILIPMYNEVGASFATMISYLLLTFFYSFISQKLFRIKYNLKFIIWALLLLLGIFFLGQLNIFIRIFLLFLCMLTIYIKKDIIMEFVK
jgi:O-antigen/teichoic acid export membrane protein